MQTIASTRQPIAPAQRVFLIGDFPGLTEQQSFSAAARLLRDWLRSYPDGRPRLESPNAEVTKVVASAFTTFTTLQDDGLLPENARYQVNLAMPEAATAAEMRAAVQRLTQIVPGERLAIVLEIDIPDLAHRCAAFTPAETTNALALRAAVIGGGLAQLPVAAEASVRLSCLSGAQYKITLADAALMTGLANAISAATARPLDLVHIPVPLKHEDDGFFRPLASLDLPRETSVALGLIHLSDGVPGALRRIDLAKPHLASFALAARSGFGERRPDEVPGALDLHAQLMSSLSMRPPAHGQTQLEERCDEVAR